MAPQLRCSSTQRDHAGTLSIRPGVMDHKTLGREARRYGGPGAATSKGSCRYPSLG